ncbi:hypothetical protein Trco_003591 [Trichoderma cornu-damae]|uniref:Uncharacterized protein n=1 Tax=Trichoderma cornu-damae TaxID=654480 RepID=A0A9P8QQB9_9HYPO|nr:hypothetical protein Trco_003591 [Trichoderma cornu-damae]
MCVYTVASVVYENCLPDPPHLVKCVVFQKCTGDHDIFPVCQNPGINLSPAVMPKLRKKGMCSVCPNYITPVSTGQSTESEDSPAIDCEKVKLVMRDNQYGSLSALPL